MKQFLKMKNTIQTYPWGSHRAIGKILGEPVPTAEPQAELWMGAHPKAPSAVYWQGDWHPLTEILTTHAEEILGTKGVRKYGTQFPYLFKILAAAEPLSIQAHPNKQQAQAGFDRENRLQVPLNAGHRNYKDNNHKPECLCALTPFWGLCGFRPVADIIRLMGAFLPAEFDDLLLPLKNQSNAQGLKTFFHQLMTLPKTSQCTLINAVMARAKTDADPAIESDWLKRIFSYYPEDIGVLSPLFLNLICLAPGQAVFLKAGVLHAYLQGTGIELMANSDNVLRGGLTAKHIDVDELMQVLEFESGAADICSPVDSGNCQRTFVSPVEEFELSIITVNDPASYTSPTRRGAEILLCTEGGTTLTDLDSQRKMDLPKGASILVPADLARYNLSGSGVIYRAHGSVGA